MARHTALVALLVVGVLIASQVEARSIAVTVTGGSYSSSSGRGSFSTGTSSTRISRTSGGSSSIFNNNGSYGGSRLSKATTVVRSSTFPRPAPSGSLWERRTSPRTAKMGRSSHFSTRSSSSFGRSKSNVFSSGSVQVSVTGSGSASAGTSVSSSRRVSTSRRG